jgi:lysine decarboxylase
VGAVVSVRLRSRDRTSAIADSYATGTTPVDILNGQVPGLLRFCTPSIALGQDRIRDALSSDISISAADVRIARGVTMGIPAGAGMFDLTRRLAARRYGATGVLLGSNGSTGSVQVVLKYLDLSGLSSILIDRQAHHSALDAAIANDLSIRYARTGYRAAFEEFEPVTCAEVIGSLRLHQDIEAVVITSPTYGGLFAPVAEIAAIMRREFPRVLLIVDAAWGAHQPFHPDLPPTPLEQGCDIAVVSPHKLGGALQPASLCLWGERVDGDRMLAAHDELATTSPSQLILASLDASLREMDRRGEALIDRSIAMADALRSRIRAELPHVAALSGGPNVAADPVKVTLATAATGVSGYDVAARLLDHGIVVEKAGRCSVTLVFTLQLPDHAAEAAADALVAILGDAAGPPLAPTPNPYKLLHSAPELAPRAAQRLARQAQCRVKLEDAVGRIAGQRVDIYPPGIPAIVPGFRISRETVTFLLAAEADGARLATNGPWDGTLLVVPRRQTEPRR